MAGVRPITDIFLPYVLEMPGEVEEDGMSLAMVLCVVRKKSGVLLAAPSNFFLAEVLEAGQIAGPDDLVGPSVLMHVPGGRLDQMNGSPPVAAPYAWVDVMVVDMSPDILDQLTPVAEYDGPTELLHLFDTDPFVYPLRDDLVSMTWDWLVQPSSVERIQYYSAGSGDSGCSATPTCSTSWSKSRRFAYWSRKRTEASESPESKEAFCGFSGHFLRVGDGGSPCSHKPDCRVEPEDKDYGGEDAGAR